MLEFLTNYWTGRKPRMVITRSMIFRILLSNPVILTLFSGMVCCSNSGNNAAHGNSAMTVLTAVNGKVQVQKYGSPNWNDAAIGMTLLKGDKIKTDNVSTASITFFDGSIIELYGGTEISLDELISKSASSSNIIKIGQTIGETSSKIVKLIDSAAQYEVTDMDVGKPKTFSGQELLNQGLSVEIGQQPGSALLKYRKL